MLLIVEKGIRGRICYSSIHRYAKANNKYMKNYDRNKESSYLGGQFHKRFQNLIANGLKILLNLMTMS